MRECYSWFGLEAGGRCEPRGYDSHGQGRCPQGPGMPTWQEDPEHEERNNRLRGVEVGCGKCLHGHSPSRLSLERVQEENNVSGSKGRNSLNFKNGNQVRIHKSASSTALTKHAQVSLPCLSASSDHGLSSQLEKTIDSILT